MKLICITMAIVTWLGVGSVWEEEQAIKSVLNRRLTIYGGAQIYQASGEFSSTKEGRPEIKLDLDDLDLDKTDKFLLRYGGGWMSLTYSDYSGRLLFANAFLEYWPFRYAVLERGTGMFQRI